MKYIKIFDSNMMPCGVIDIEGDMSSAEGKYVKVIGANMQVAGVIQLGNEMTDAQKALLFQAYDQNLMLVGVGVTESLSPSDPTAIDLGLPSGTKWRSMNLGATAPEEAGLYYSWGNVQGHTASEGYEWGTDNEGPYAQTTGAGLTGDIPANATYDAAVAALGGNWRMPTNADFDELINNCDWTWKQVNGVNGYEVKSKASGNTNSIFLPAAGSGGESSVVGVGSYGGYRSSSAYSDDTGIACYLYFIDEAFYTNLDYRFYGLSVRPVQNAS